MPAYAYDKPDAFSVLFTTTGYAQMQENFLRAYEFLEASGYSHLASLLRRAFFRFREEVLEAARIVAMRAEEYVKEEEVKSRRRPDTGGDGGPRLQEFLGQSRPLNAVPGSVGVNFEPVLYDNVSWWWTQEEGYSGHVGRVVHGFFFDQGFTGRSRPDPSAFREHPLFRAEGPQRPDNAMGRRRQKKLTAPRSGSRGTRPGMLIQRPIEDRRFVKRGAERAEAEWHEKIRKARTRFDTELDRIEGMFRRRA